MTIRDLETATGMSRVILKRLCFENDIPMRGAVVPDEFAKKVIDETQTYIGLREYCKRHTSQTFDGSNCNDREKLCDYLENMHFFGLKKWNWDQFLTGNPLDKFYFHRGDIEILDERLKMFFQYFGVPEEEKIFRLLNEHDNDLTVRMLKKFFLQFGFNEKITPSVTSFVQNILKCPDLQNLEKEGLSEILKRSETEVEKTLLIRFLNFTRTELDVEYSALHRKTRDSNPIPAYSAETYLKLAFLVFNPEHIYKEKMIEKSLEEGVDAERWLYVALFFLCGWRAGDVCREWRYPNLKQFPERCEYLGITIDTLQEDILRDRIPEETLSEICMYSMGAIESFGPQPHKTKPHNPSPLRSVITESLYPFVGLLTLIGECCHLKSDSYGYMQENRTAVYQNIVQLRSFFGDEIEDVLDGCNLLTRRMNKSYLQGIEDAARRRGIGGVLASSVASLTRNHINLDTIRMYLRDHTLTGEDAGTVLFMMFERGVFGAQLYRTVLTAFPSALEGLPMKERTSLLKRLDISPLELEIAGAEAMTQAEMRDVLVNGEEQSAISILIALFSICQGNGIAKDEGCYCMRRARGDACIHGQFKSCIANGCRDVVVTMLGIMPLLETLKKFYDAANEGDIRAKAVFTTILLPKYKGILNEVMRYTHMDPNDRGGLRDLMLEVLNE